MEIIEKSSESKLNREQINCSALMNLHFYPALQNMSGILRLAGEITRFLQMVSVKAFLWSHVPAAQ
jgi:hypothetical protein